MKGFQGRRILVSGYENLLGRKVVLRLLDLGANVSLFRLREEERCRSGESFSSGCPVVSAADLDRISPSSGFEDILFLNNPEILPNDLVEGPFIDIQLLDLNKLLNLAGRHASYFVYASSVSVYGKQRYLPIDEDHPLEPTHLYGAVKLAGESFCRATALERGFFYTIIRFGDIYGPGGSDVSAPAVFLRRVIKGGPMVIKGRGGQVRSYLYIDDAVEAVIKVLGCKIPNQIINIAGNEYTSIWHLANLIKQQYSTKTEIKTSSSILVDEIECCVDSSKAEEILSFKPRFDLASGLSNTYRWMLENESKIKSYIIEGV